MNEFQTQNNGPKNMDSLGRRPVVSSVLKTAAEPVKSAPSAKPRGKKILKKILAGIVLAILVLGGVVTLRASSLADKIFVGKKTTFFEKVKDLIRGGGDNVKLQGENLGQINILLLGIGGVGHDGPYLSDTMILAEIRPDIGQVALISIPRDYLVALPDNYGSRKINAAFAEGYNKNKDWDEGGKWARQVVEKLTGLTIPYFAVVDFSGFEQAVDKVGGLDIQIDNTFTDYSYPDSDNGYLPPVTFTQGSEHMTGTRALEFARSRHAAGSEGSDFARSARQQKIISAFKQKILSLNLISNAGTINSLLSTFADHFHTNITPGELYRLFNLVKNDDIKTFISLSLDPETSLICPKIMEDTGAYVLTPCEGKTDEDVQNFFKNAFATGAVRQEKATVWLSTSTGDKTIYQAADQKLKEAGVTVWELGYSGEALNKNIFYQVNAKSATAEFIKNSLHATEATLPPPGVKIDKDKVDIIVILGKDN